MKKITVLLSAMMGLLPLTSISAHAAYGTPSEGWGFVQDDWQVVCDNTRTCRAAGYTSEALIDEPASVLLTVLPKVALPTAQVQFVSESSEDNFDNAQLWLNDKNYGTLQLAGKNSQIYDLSAKQTQALINHARAATKIEIRAGDNRWTISDKGMSAVLLKLDDVQGRVGTPIALVSKNNANRQTPKAAKAKPVIKKASAYSEEDKKQIDAKKLVYLQQNINKWVDIDSEQLTGAGNAMGACELVNPKTEAYQRMSEYSSNMLGWDFVPVDKTHTLASHLCWSGPYNSSTGYWLINHDKPSKPELITTSGNEYEAGEIWATHKDRGIGDCWNRATWIWDGKTFTKSEETSTGMCRGFAGGAWDLPTYVSEVIENNSKASK